MGIREGKREAEGTQELGQGRDKPLPALGCGELWSLVTSAHSSSQVTVAILGVFCKAQGLTVLS